MDVYLNWSVFYALTSLVMSIVRHILRDIREYRCKEQGVCSEVLAELSLILHVYSVFIFGLCLYQFAHFVWFILKGFFPAGA